MFPTVEGNIEYFEKKIDKTVQFFCSFQKEMWQFYGSLSSWNLLHLQSSKHYTKLSNFNLKFNLRFNFFVNKQFPHLIKFILPFYNNFKNLTYLLQKGIKRKQDRSMYFFQKITSIYVPMLAMVYISLNSFLFKQSLVAILTAYSHQTDDIIQGLPKMEQLLESSNNIEDGAILSARPGVVWQLINTSFENTAFKQKLPFLLHNRNETLEIYRPNFLDISSTKNNDLNKLVVLGHSLVPTLNHLKINNKLFKVYFFSPFFKAISNGSYINFSHCLTHTILPFFSLNPFKIELGFPNFVLTLIFKYLNNLFKSLNLVFTLSPLSSKLVKVYKFKRSLWNYDYIVEFSEKISFYFEEITLIDSFLFVPKSYSLCIEPNEFIDLGEPITNGSIKSQILLLTLFYYHLKLDGRLIATFKSRIKIQLILANSLHSIYYSQDIKIPNKNIELIIRQLTSIVSCLRSGHTPFFLSEVITFNDFVDIIKSLNSNVLFKKPIFIPKLIGLTNLALNTHFHKQTNFLASSTFQGVSHVLSNAAIEGTRDWLDGVKEASLMGKTIPVGSTFLTYKTHLDNTYLYKILYK